MMITIDEAIYAIAAMDDRVELMTDEPHKMAKAIRARLYRDGITGKYGISIEGNRLHIYKTRPAAPRPKQKPRVILRYQCSIIRAGSRSRRSAE